MKYEVRLLKENDFETYKKIRLELLKEEPTNFGSSFEDESQFDDSVWKERLSKKHVFTFGSFMDDEIVGVCVLVVSPREKMKHVGTIHSMYVKHKFRNQGIAYDLIIESEKVAYQNKVERLNLSVVENNIKAYNLYYKLGFKEYGIEPDAIKFMDEYYSLRLMSKVL